MSIFSAINAQVTEDLFIQTCGKYPISQNNLPCLSGMCGQNDNPNTQDVCKPMWIL